MRKGSGSQILENVGINLGADFCAEHEWGIRGIKNAFGIPELSNKCIGIKSKTVSCFPKEHLYYVENKNSTYLVFMDSDYFTPDVKVLENLLPKYREENLVCAWDERSFGIRTETDEGRSFLKRLYEAFEKKDVAIYFGGRQSIIGNVGLCIIIVDMVSDNLKQAFKEQDTSYLKLQEAFTKTKIEDKLKKSGKKWFALSPKWANKEETEIEVWLNPCDQKNHNYGWMSIQDLEDWAQGKGRVIKNG